MSTLTHKDIKAKKHEKIRERAIFIGSEPSIIEKIQSKKGINYSPLPEIILIFIDLLNTIKLA
jgi:hypothetical protein